MRPILAAVVLQYPAATACHRLLADSPGRLYKSNPTRYTGVDANCTRHGSTSWHAVSDTALDARIPGPCSRAEMSGGSVNAANTVSESRATKQPSELMGNGRAGPMPCHRASAWSFHADSPVLTAADATNLGTAAPIAAYVQSDSVQFACKHNTPRACAKSNNTQNAIKHHRYGKSLTAQYVPEYTAKTTKKLGCLRNAAGFAASDKKPSFKLALMGILPEAFEMMLLSKIETTAGRIFQRLNQNSTKKLHRRGETVSPVASADDTSDKIAAASLGFG
ncbi:hypothetical protein HDU84_006933 [Entophlyctis sp. JEL0112]|nr:hypothetical protein HDU84_006933 [Entophlyctis sp. JEL0112]